MRSALIMLCVASGLLLPARAGAEVFERDDVITNPTWQRFSVCYDNGCRSLAEVSLTEAQ